MESKLAHRGLSRLDVSRTVKAAIATVIAASALMISTAGSASARSGTTISVGGAGSSAAAVDQNSLQGGSGSFTAKVAKVEPKTGATLKAKTVLCEWNADWKWGPGTVSQVTGSARFYCAAVGPDGPQFTGESRARLMDDHGKAIANGERTVIQPLDPTPTISEVTAKVKRPKTLHVQHDMWANFLTPGWVWQSHPKGCGGAGTTAIKCTIDYENFKI